MTTETKIKLEPLPKEWWGNQVKNPNCFGVWTSSEFTVQAFHVTGGVVRLAINRRQTIMSSRVFADGISWEDIQTIKDSCGYADRMAVEIYPESKHILNVINARHLWILPAPLPFAWRSRCFLCQSKRKSLECFRKISLLRSILCLCLLSFSYGVPSK